LRSWHFAHSRRRPAAESPRRPLSTNAFKALVKYPGHAGRIPGATPENLKHALDRVCDALLADDRIMPGGTLDAVRGTIPDETEMLGGRYSHGAAVVRQHLPRFRALFREGVMGMPGASGYPAGRFVSNFAPLRRTTRSTAGHVPKAKGGRGARRPAWRHRPLDPKQDVDRGERDQRDQRNEEVHALSE
jgi:hypothetical protein